MDPVIEHADLDPPRPRGILSRGLPVAVLAHVLLAVALAWGVAWKWQGDPLATLPSPATTAGAPSTSAMGSGPAPSPAGTRATPPADPPAQARATARPPAASPPAPVRRPEPAPARQVRSAPAPATTVARVSPSFDCAKARSTPERLICADPELSRLDRELGSLYARARAAAPNAAAFRRQQDVEWRRREQTCRDRECLLRWYAQRRVQLEESLAGRS